MKRTTSSLGDYFASRRERGDEGLPLLSVTLRDGLVPRNTIERRFESELEDHEHLAVRTGDIAYNMMRMWQGASGLAPYNAAVSPAYVVLRPSEEIDPTFASYWFKSARMIYLFWAYSYGLTEDRLRLYYKDFAAIPAEPPPLTDQRKIAAILSECDRAIAEINALVAAKRRRKAGLLNVAFAPARDLSPPLTMGWHHMPMSSLAKIVGGGTPATAESTYWGGDVAWCTPSDLTKLSSRWLYETERTLTAEGLKACNAEVLPVGSVVLCSRASVGACAIARVPVATNQGFQSLVPKREGDSLFLYYLAQAIGRRLLRISAGSTFLEFPAGELAKLVVAAPDPEQRQRIGAAFAAIDDEIDLLAAQAEALRHQKRGLTQKLLPDEWRGNAASARAAAE